MSTSMFRLIHADDVVTGGDGCTARGPGGVGRVNLPTLQAQKVDQFRRLDAAPLQRRITHAYSACALPRSTARLFFR